MCSLMACSSVTPPPPPQKTTAEGRHHLNINQLFASFFVAHLRLQIMTNGFGPEALHTSRCPFSMPVTLERPRRAPEKTLCCSGQWERRMVSRWSRVAMTLQGRNRWEHALAVWASRTVSRADCTSTDFTPRQRKWAAGSNNATTAVSQNAEHDAK